MNSVIKLSHTAKELYLKSPRAYFYHYFLNIREKTMGSPLFFGSLIETGLESLFKGESLEKALETFNNNFKTTTYNGKIENLMTSKNIRYSKSDLDLDLFTDVEREDLLTKDIQQQSYLSLKRKGELLITAYYNDIFPKIKKVIKTQHYFSISNGAGDEIMGYADMICEWEDGRTLVLDHKTTSITYPADSVLTEQYGKQIALYFDALKDEFNLDGAGFLVLEKKIRKREPRARTQIIIDVPPGDLVEKTLDEFDSVLYNIKQGQFGCNSPKCDAYGQSCPYKKYCCSNGTDLTGLVKVGKQK